MAHARLHLGALLAAIACVFGSPSAAQVLSAAHVKTLAALQAASTVYYPNGLWRDGAITQNDAPPLYYTPSSVVCPKGSGTSDGAVQVASADGKYWCATAPAEGWDIREWGAQPTGADTHGAWVAALGAFTYSAASSTGSGPLIIVPGLPGCFYTANTIDVTARHGLHVHGSGPYSACMTNLNGSTHGNYPIFTVASTVGGNTLHQTFDNLMLIGSGLSNTSNKGFQFHYANSAKIEDNYFLGFYQAIDLEGAYDVYLTQNRFDGQGVSQNGTCVNMGLPTDVLDTTHNNSALLIANFCGNVASYGWRWQDAQGSEAIGNYWLNGTTGVYGCDPSSSTNPDGSNVICQFVEVHGDQSDTHDAECWKIIQGSAAALTTINLHNIWAGSCDQAATSGVAGIEIDGASNGWSVDNFQEQNQEVGYRSIASINGRISGHVKSYNVADDGSPAVILNASSGIAVSVTSTSATTAIGYNGIVENTGSKENPFYGIGLANCTLGLSIGATAQTPANPGCTYDIEGLKVHVQMYMELAAKTGSGNVTLTSLPYASQASSISNSALGNISALVCAQACASLTGTIQAQVGQNSITAALVQQDATGTASLTDANLNPSSSPHTIISGSIDYFKN